MSAEIISFGNPRSVTTRPATPVHNFPPNTTIGDRHSASQRPPESVRFMFDGYLYQARFCGDEVQKVFAIQYRITDGGVQELKRSYWSRGHYSRCEIGPAFVEAAQRARQAVRAT